MNPECPDSDRSDLSISLTILMREEPDDEDEDEEEHDGGREDNDGTMATRSELIRQLDEGL
jgi:hypothetical protein